MFSVSFVVIFGGVVVFGHRESVGKLKKKSFRFFFTMKPSRLKIMEKVFIFFVVRLVMILFGCQESVGKLKILFSFLYQPAPTQYSSPIMGRRKFR